MPSRLLSANKLERLTIRYAVASLDTYLTSEGIMLQSPSTFQFLRLMCLKAVDFGWTALTRHAPRWSPITQPAAPAWYIHSWPSDHLVL